MSKMIDADAYRDEFMRGVYDELADDTDNYRANRIIGLFDNAPTIDAVPVRHAYWYWDKDGMDWNIGAWRCSACHNRPNTIWETEKNLHPRRWSGSAYCSNCGAVMDGKEKTDED